MNRSYRLQFCRVCKKKDFSREKGIICSLTNEQADFQESCPHFEEDTALAVKEKIKNQHDLSHSKKESLFGNLYTSYITLMILGIFISVLSYALGRSAFVGLLAGVLVLLFSSVIAMIILYRIWSFIVNECKIMNIKPSIDSPGKAIGFLFIPLFNLGWIFYAYGKVAGDLNRLSVARNNSTVMSSGLGLIICIFILSGIIPVAGIAMSLISGFVLLPVFLKTAIEAIGEIPPLTDPDLYKEMPVEEEKVKLSAIKDFLALFDQKNYGVNYQLGLFLFLAIILSQTFARLFIFSFDGMSVFIHSLKGIYNLRDIIQTLLFSFGVVLLGHTVKQKYVLPIAVGLFNATLQIVFGYIFYLLNKENLSSYNESYVIHNFIGGFVNGFLFILALVLFINNWGMRFWSIAAGAIGFSIISFFFWPLMGFLFFDSEFQLFFRGGIYLLVTALFEASGIYLAAVMYFTSNVKSR